MMDNTANQNAVLAGDERAGDEQVVAAKPPRARVADAPLEDRGDHGTGDQGSGDPASGPVSDDASRPRDYLDGFLQEKPAAQPSGEPGGELYEAVVAALRDIFDPEIPVNIYDLGLIYGVDVSPDADVVVTMTLTTPHCPVAETMPTEVEMRIMNVPGVRDAEVEITWDPAWDPSKMSDEARLELGML